MKITIDTREVNEAVTEWLKNKYPELKIGIIVPILRKEGRFEDIETFFEGYEAVITPETKPEELIGIPKIKKGI